VAAGECSDVCQCALNNTAICETSPCHPNESCKHEDRVIGIICFQKTVLSFSDVLKYQLKFITQNCFEHNTIILYSFEHHKCFNLYCVMNC